MPSSMAEGVKPAEPIAIYFTSKQLFSSLFTNILQKTDKTVFVFLTVLLYSFLSLLYIYIISYFFYKINKQYLIAIPSIKFVGQCLTIYIEDFSYRIMEVSYVERITIRLDEVEKELLQEYAEENDTTISQVIRRLIKEFLDEKFER